MATGSPSRQHIKVNGFRYASVVLRWIIEPSASVEEKQRRRVRLLSTFLLLITINTLTGAIAVKNAGNSSWPIMLVTAAILAAGYVLSRTGYHRLATVLAVTVPAFPIFTMALFSLNQANVPVQLPWLALPLLVSSLLLSLRRTMIVAISYIAIIVVLIPFIDAPTANLIQSLAFMFMIFFFVIAVTAVRRHDQSEVERQLTERKQMEEALAASESDKKSILNAISDLVIFQDSSLTTKWANEAAARSIGKSPQDLVGKHCYQLWHKRNKPCDDCPVIRALETKSSVSGSMTTPDGRSWDVSGEPVYDSDGKIIGAIEIARDITERKRAEEALRINEERFRLIADNATDLISRIQMAPTIRTDYVSPSCLRFTGYKQEEFYNDPNLGLEMIHPDDREFFQKYLTSDNKKHQKPITIRLVRKDGSIIWIEQTHSIISDENGEPVAMHLIARDITERKRAEEALANEAIRRRILIEQSRDGIVVLDHNGNVYESNRRFAEMLGYSLEEVRQLQVWDWEFLYPPEQVREMIRSVDETGDHFETQHRRKDGTIYDVEISTNGATFAGQKLIFCVCRDITGRKQAEEKLKQALSELEQSSARLAATNKELETFSYSVSHDLRSPLRSIDGFSQALLEDYSDKLDENGQDYLKRLRGASQKMGELIDGLLKLSRLTRSEMHAEPVDLSALAEEIATGLQEMRQGHRAKFIIDKGLTANGDPQLLRVLLENLLGNAWKFTGKTPHAKIEFGTTRNNGKKTYFVKDNGAGFDMTYADKLFGAFQRLHDSTEFPGTGIGLATVQRIINRHGGTIQAEGAVGKGATFHFTLD